MKKSGVSVSDGRPYPLGMTVISDREVNLSAVMRRKGECGVIFTSREEGRQLRLPFREENRIGNLCCMKLSGIRAKDDTYRFYDEDGEWVDPYARRIYGNETWGEQISPQLSGGGAVSEFDWGEDAPPLTPLCDSLLYQIHVRGFTMHPSSRVKQRGTFAGVMEKIPYLKTLGVTALELMPVYEFAELEWEKPILSLQEEEKKYRDRQAEDEKPRINYWGFKEGYYFAPKASYSASADPIREFKQLVKQLHENGIEVILQFFFPRKIRQSFILDVVKFWVEEYHIDGVHLLGERIPTTLLATEPMLSDTKILCGDFSCGEIYPEQTVPAMKNLARFSDDFLYDMRRFLKGDEDMVGRVLYQLKKNPAQTGVINFITNYEGFTLADLVSYERKHNEENGEENRDGIAYNASWNCGEEGPTKKRSIRKLREKQMRNAMLLLLTAQGTPLIVAGDEFGFSRGGNNNPWCQDNEINWLNWNLNAEGKRMLEFVTRAVAMRRAHPVLHRPDELTMMDYIACGYPDLSYHGREAWKISYDRICREVGVMYCGRYARPNRQTEDDFFYIAYNMHWEETEMALPALPGTLRWEVVLDSAGEGGKKEAEALIRPDERTVRVRERSVLILKSGPRAERKQ